MDTHSPKAVVQLSNNSNYHQPFEGGNCLSDIIKVVEDAMFFYCSLWHNCYWAVCNVYNHLTEDKGKTLPIVNTSLN